MFIVLQYLLRSLVRFRDALPLRCADTALTLPPSPPPCPRPPFPSRLAAVRRNIARHQKSTACRPVPDSASPRYASRRVRRGGALPLQPATAVGARPHNDG